MASLDPDRVGDVYQKLLNHFGTQAWWPAESQLEVMVGAVLTQNTAWRNVEKAIIQLKAAGYFADELRHEWDIDLLAGMIRPAGYYNLKARRLSNLVAAVQCESISALEQRPTAELREWFLGVNGVGPETADDILLYAFDRPVFVIDAYTRRLSERLGWIEGGESYDKLSERFSRAIGPDYRIYAQYHALIVEQAKQYCTKNRPECPACPLLDVCCFAGV